MIDFLKNSDKNRFTRFAIGCLIAQAIYVAAASIVFMTQKGPPHDFYIKSILGVSVAAAGTGWLAATFERDWRWIALPLASLAVIAAPFVITFAFEFIILAIAFA